MIHADFVGFAGEAGVVQGDGALELPHLRGVTGRQAANGKLVHAAPSRWIRAPKQLRTYWSPAHRRC
jgi:hypothetical protein